MLDYTMDAAVTPNGVLNISVANKCAWMELECDVKYLIVVPRRAKFGLARSYENNVEVLFWPQVNAPQRPIMSFIFDADTKYCCDATFEGLFMTKMTCKRFNVSSVRTKISRRAVFVTGYVIDK